MKKLFHLFLLSTFLLTSCGLIQEPAPVNPHSEGESIEVQGSAESSPKTLQQ